MDMVHTCNSVILVFEKEKEVPAPMVRRSIQMGECVPALGGWSPNRLQGPSNSCCRVSFVPQGPASPKSVLLSARFLAQEEFLYLH